MILLFWRTDKTVFDVYRSGLENQESTWLVLVLALISYFLLLWFLWPFLSAPEIPLLGYL